VASWRFQFAMRNRKSDSARVCHRTLVGLRAGRAKGPQYSSPGQTREKKESPEGATHVLMRPFRAGSVFTHDPGRCPGLECFRTFGASPRSAQRCMTRSKIFSGASPDA
jgi:hypothetical protein